MDRQAQRDSHRKLNCLKFAQECGSNAPACRIYGVSKSSFYYGKAGYREKGEADDEGHWCSLKHFIVAGHLIRQQFPGKPASGSPHKIFKRFLLLLKTISKYFIGPGDNRYRYTRGVAACT